MLVSCGSAAMLVLYISIIIFYWPLRVSEVVGTVSRSCDQLPSLDTVDRQLRPFTESSIRYSKVVGFAAKEAKKFIHGSGTPFCSKYTI